MSVLENIIFFCGFRDMDHQSILDYADKMLARVGMSSKKDALAMTISGG